MKFIIKKDANTTYEYNENFWSGKKELLINNTPAEKIGKNQFKIGADIVTLKGNFITGLSLVYPNGNVEVLCKNKWYEWVLMILPILNIVAGVFFGAIGGGLSALFGLAAAAVNAVTLRSNLNFAVKILICVVSIIVSVGAWFGLTLLIAGGLTGLIK